MTPYIGTKVINAKPMTRLEYNKFRGWELPADENPADEGYLVEYVDGGQANTKEFTGYVSWSPKEVFERAYRENGKLTFGDALVYLKEGKKVARDGWNGKGLWLELQTPDENSKMTLPYIFINYPADARNTPNAKVPWLASQTDMLAEDWMVLN